MKESKVPSLEYTDSLFVQQYLLSVYHVPGAVGVMVGEQTCITYSLRENN